MKSELAGFSEEKQKRLQEHLIGAWAEDTWVFIEKNNPKNRERVLFTLMSPSIRTEIKYAAWSQFDSGRWKLGAYHHTLGQEMRCIIQWLGHFPQPVQSLMERSLEQWEESFRDYLVQTGLFRSRKAKYLSADQEYIERQGEDPRICLFRRFYKIVSAAYDDRPETEKDIWDMRRMKLDLNLTSGRYFLNFTVISQPWLRCLIKDFLKYKTTIHSAGDCHIKLQALAAFSRFLAENHPNACAQNIDRALICQYISFLQKDHAKDEWKLTLLGCLRSFLETCAQRLHKEEITKERLIFNDDLPKRGQKPSREIPEEVLEQLREHLETLDTTGLRMVVILLECGMRVSELCSLPLDCLACANKGEWSLRFYQWKSKQEHIIPLVDDAIVEAIQAQQETIRQQWGNMCPYLFPSFESHSLPYKAQSFALKLNKWAREKNIRDSTGKLHHFQTHQFRHTLGMRLINDDVSLDVIGRLLGHSSLEMTQVYAKKRKAKILEELERAWRNRKTVDFRGQVVTGDAQANDPDVQFIRSGIRGQSLPVGGCGRLMIRGDCEHANKCLTCTSWLTSIEDLPALRVFHTKAIRVRQRAQEVGNKLVLQNQDKIIPLLAVRIKGLEDTSTDALHSRDELLAQLRAELIEVEVGREEAINAGSPLIEKLLERKATELKARIAEVEKYS